MYWHPRADIKGSDALNSSGVRVGEERIRQVVSAIWHQAGHPAMNHLQASILPWQ